jgi:hypothetical protein
MLGAVCLFLASKALERPVPILKICRTYHDLTSELRLRQNPKLLIPPIQRTALEQLRFTIASLEIGVLSALNFELDVELPYAHLAQFR